MNEANNVKEHSSLLPLLAVIVAIGLGYLVINPKIAELRSLNNQISAKNLDITAMQEKINNLTILKQKFSESPGDVELLNLAVPKDSQIPEIIEEVTAMAGKSGLEVNAINPVVQQTSSGETEVSISVNGDYISFVNFSENLEKNIRPVTFKSVNIASQVQASGSIKLNATITLGFLTYQNKSTSSVSN